MFNDIKHHIISLLFIHICPPLIFFFFFGETSVDFYFWVIRFKKNILATSSLTNRWFSNILCKSVTCIFIFSKVLCKVQRVFMSIFTICFLYMWCKTIKKFTKWSDKNLAYVIVKSKWKLSKSNTGYNA